MGYQVIDAPEGTAGYRKGSGEQIFDAAAKISRALKNKFSQNKTEAYKQALEKEGYEKQVTITDSGKTLTRFAKPKTEKEGTTERFLRMMGYDKMSAEQLREAIKTDPALRAIVGVKEQAKTSALAQTGKTLEGIKKLDKYLYGDPDKDEPGLSAEEDEGELLKKYIIEDFPALEAEGYDMKQVVKHYSPKLSQYGLRDSLPEPYRQYVTDIPAKAPSKKFNWGNVLSPVNVGANIQMR